MLWIHRLWNKFTRITVYKRDKHYKILDSDQYILEVIITKGPHVDQHIDYTILLTDEDYTRAQIIPRFTLDDGEREMTDGMYNIAYQIFSKEYKTALDNYNRLKQEILQDEDDRTDNIEESDAERTVSPQGNSLSKRRVFSTQRRKTRVPRDAAIHSKVQPPADHGSDSDIFGGEK